MLHEAYLPNPRLTPFIRCYFHIRVDSGEFHFPADGCPGLLINLKDPFLLGFHRARLDQFHGCRLFGSPTRNMLTRHVTGQTELLAVKFRPGQLPRFFDLPANELTDTCVSIQHLWGIFGRELQERFLEAKNLQQLIHLLDDALINRLTRKTDHDSRIFAALQTIFDCHGQVQIMQLASRLNLGRRQFERRFGAAVGLPPKRMCRIVRFLNVFSTLQATPRPDWADLAIASGYSDQAHLIRECNYFTGRSPVAYLEKCSSLEHTVLGTTDGMSHLFNTVPVSSAIKRKDFPATSEKEETDERIMHSGQSPQAR
jgi:AraC-like DNA-binding protein